MKQFTYIVKDPLGIHARPAGQIVKQAKEYPDTLVTITKGEKTVNAAHLMKLMSLGVKTGDTIVLTCEGPNEENALEVIGNFLCDNL